uniref:Mitochondrial import receptor subunit TOM22 homolog n=1 Tax=Mesocestoides corti TaxID=53468 RepID=A0A5K3EWC4_MESCO
MCSERLNDDFIQVDVLSDEAPSEPVLEASSVLTQSSPPTAPTGIRTLTVDEVSRGYDEDDDDDSDFEDETIIERLIGLTEMFPDWLRNGTSAAFDHSIKVLSGAYSLSRSIAWFVASTSTICLFPLMLELERNQMEEQEALEHRSMMLGPGGVSNVPMGPSGFQVNVPILAPAAK